MRTTQPIYSLRLTWLLTAADLSFNPGSDTEEEEIQRLIEEADCEEAELLLEQSKENEQSTSPIPATQIRVRDIQASTHSVNPSQVCSIPPSTRRQLRRPRPETIELLDRSANIDHSQITQATQESATERGDGYWLSSTEVEQSNNSIQWESENNWEAIYDTFYSHPIDNGDSDSPPGASYSPSSYLTSGDLSEYSTEHSRGSSDRNILRAGSAIYEPPVPNFRVENGRDSIPNTRQTDYTRRPQHSSAGYGGYPIPIVPTPEPTQLRRRSQHTRRSGSPYGSEFHRPTARRRTRRIQDDSWVSLRDNGPGESVLAQYRRAHENTSPNNIHLSVRYRSPGYRMESRLNACSTEIEQLRSELRELRSTDSLTNGSNRNTRRQRTQYRW